MNISLANLTKRYGSTRALDQISLHLAPGQIIAVLGPNGAGKTTLLRSLAGLVAPDAGAIRYDDAPFSRGRLDLRRRLFFLPDVPILFWDQTVLRNLGIILRLYQALPEDGGQRVAGLLAEFDLLPLAGIPAVKLSRGQSYKAALTALLAVDPELWLLDEPFSSGMDPHGINAFKHHARAAAQQGRTIIYTTQLIDVAERFADQICVLHQGKIHAFGQLDNLRRQVSAQGGVLEQLFRDLRESDH